MVPPSPTTTKNAPPTGVFHFWAETHLFQSQPRVTYQNPTHVILYAKLLLDSTFDLSKGSRVLGPKLWRATVYTHPHKYIKQHMGYFCSVSGS